MMRQAFSVEWFKLRRLRLFRAVVLLGIALSCFWVAFGLWMARRGGPAVREEFAQRLTFPGAYEQAFGLAAAFGETFLAIVAATFVANEYGWGTWRLILLTGLPRWQELAAKFLALCTGAGIFVVAVALVPLVAAPLIARSLGYPALAIPRTDGWLVAAFLLPVRAVGSLVAPITLAFASTVWTRSQSVAVGVTVGFVLSEGVLAALLQGIGGWWAKLPQFFYLWNAEAIARAPAFSEAAVPGMPPLGHAIAVVLAWTVTLAAATIWWFARRDIEVRSNSA
ncbi:MAG: ABC transporter permease [Thermomicrobium sp.]|nr:ABC transporter permease [Thermomicrobium sp.]